MGTVKQAAFRFTPDDLALLDQLQDKLGIVNRTDILRMAIRVLAEKEGISVARPKRKPRPLQKRTARTFLGVQAALGSTPSTEVKPHVI